MKNIKQNLFVLSCPNTAELHARQRYRIRLQWSPLVVITFVRECFDRYDPENRRLFEKRAKSVVKIDLIFFFFVHVGVHSNTRT